MTAHDRPARTVLVWDLPTRLFHWLLVALVAIAWATGETEGFGFLVHKLAGYGVMVAILFRLIWGFIGSRHSLFRDFLHPWPVVRDYAKGLLALRPRPTIGHNPLGGWMIVLLMGTLVAVVGTGLVAGGEGGGGPLIGSLGAGMAAVMAEIHGGLTSFLFALIAIHVAGVAVGSVLGAHNLVRPMLTGRKRLSPDADGAAAAGRIAPGWYSALALAVATGLTWWLVA